MKQKLWTKDYTLFILATVMGSVGGVASGFALSFLVFDETGSTLASAFLLAVELIPAFIVPLIAAPIMDRFPRKPDKIEIQGVSNRVIKTAESKYDDREHNADGGGQFFPRRIIYRADGKGDQKSAKDRRR